MSNEYTDSGLCGEYWKVKIALENDGIESIASTDRIIPYPVKYLGKGSIETKYIIIFPQEN